MISSGGGGTLRRSKRAAFTLAEVLITLGIIGVVAALTIPALISNYQKHVWVAQLKKDVNFVLNTFNKIKQEEGADSLKHTTYYRNTSESSTNPDWGLQLNVDKLDEYLKIEHVPSGTELYSFLDIGVTDMISTYRLRDGSCISVEGTYENYGLINIRVDVNCEKNPNIGGRDRFSFTLNPDVRILSVGNTSGPCTDRSCVCTEEDAENIINAALEAELGGGRPDLSEEEKIYLEESIRDSIKSDVGSPDACFAKILRDGWQMKY